MGKKVILLLFVTNAILTIGIILFLVNFFKNSEETTVYVENIQLFNDFNMSKDLAKINNTKINKQKKKLDSLYSIYTIFKEQNTTDKIKELETQLRFEDQELRKINEYFSKEVSQQVWNRLNQYIKEYGEAKNYDIILGTQGNGNVMFARPGINITNQFLEFANTKYEGN